jgi:pimeloyl-ACP methyl ester carboxylesterase
MKTILLSVLVFVAFTACTTKTSNEPTSMTSHSQQDTAISFTSGYANVNGIKMYYEIYGEGKPLILLHGGGSTIQTTFEKVIPYLAKSHKVIAIESQAHGRTGDRSTPISFQQDADDVVALMKSLNIVQADVFGFSNGGHTTLQLAMYHPEIVDRIIIASAFYKRSGLPPQFWEFMKKGTIEDMPKQLKDGFIKVTPDSVKLQNLFEKCAYRMINFKDWRDDELRSIKAKTLLVSGDRDVASPEHTVLMHRMIPNSQLLILPGGHGEFMGEIEFENTEEKVKTFVLLIEEFLTRD